MDALDTLSKYYNEAIFFTKKPCLGIPKMLNRPLFEIFSLSSAAASDTLLSCDDGFAILDSFVELALEGSSLEEIKKHLLHHMHHHHDCREDHLQRINDFEGLWKQSQTKSDRCELINR